MRALLLSCFGHDDDADCAILSPLLRTNAKVRQIQWDDDPFILGDSRCYDMLFWHSLSFVSLGCFVSYQVQRMMSFSFLSLSLSHFTRKDRDPLFLLRIPYPISIFLSITLRNVGISQFNIAIASLFNSLHALSSSHAILGSNQCVSIYLFTEIFTFAYKENHNLRWIFIRRRRTHKSF